LDGLEVTQFTYFQQCGGQDLDPISVELTYGLERIAAFLQDVDSVYDITWAPGVKYRDVRHAEELQFSVYNFDAADVEKTWEHLRLYEAECRALLEAFAAARKPAAPPSGAADGKSALKGRGSVGRDFSPDSRSDRAEGASGEKGALAPEASADAARFPVLGAFDLCLKCSHLFNILDARGAISVTERVGVIARIRNLAVGVAKAYLEQQAVEANKPV
ncbi:MAG: glycine--tRNA ligase subunit alpha, partial [Terriglobales bacterium]